MFGASALPTEPPPLPERANFIILTSSFPVSNYSVTKRPSLFLSVGSRQIENSPKLSSDADVAHHRPPKQVPAKIVGNSSTDVPAKSCVGSLPNENIFSFTFASTWRTISLKKMIGCGRAIIKIGLFSFFSRTMRETINSSRQKKL